MSVSSRLMEDTAWETWSLHIGLPRALGGAFTPVPRVVAVGFGQSTFCSGFVIHPKMVVTAAHGVVIPTLAGSMFASALCVDLGNARVWAKRVAVPRDDRDDSYERPSADVAVLQLDTPVCNAAETLQLLATPRALNAWVLSRAASSRRDGAVSAPPSQSGNQQEPALAASLWGYAAGTLSNVDVEIRGSADGLTYPAIDLPGDSGGPVVSPAGRLDHATALGVHSHFDVQRGLGVASPISAAEIRAAGQALRLSENATLAAKVRPRSHAVAMATRSAAVAGRQL